MTTYANAENRAQVLSAGFRMHIGKPFDVEETPQQIKQLLDSMKTKILI